MIAATTTLLSLPRLEAAEASIRGDGVLLVDGRAVFPIGIRIEGDGQEHQMLAETGFNVLLGSGAVKPSYYEQASKHGLLVIAGHYIWATFASFRHGNPREIDLYAEDDAALQKAFTYTNQSRQRPLQALAAVDHHPCVFAWNTCEEPTGKFLEPLEYMYEIFKSNSPKHLVIPLSCDPDWFHIFRNSGDALMVDVYPYRGPEKSQPAVYTYDRVRHARRVLDGKPVWLMPQLYHPSYWSRNGADELTLPQMRQANYLGLIAGAQGVVMYSYSSYRTWWKDGKRIRDLRQDPLPAPIWQRRWERIRRMVEELKALAPLICDGRPTDLPLSWRPVGAGASGAAMVLTRVLDHYGSLYLLAANLAEAPVETRLRSPSRVNRDAFEASVFLGGSDLSVTPGDGPKRLPRLTLAARGCGVFRLDRRALQPRR